MSEAVAAENPQLGANIKETIESILVAFILAFIFRAFVVEAFVIPTGSMAPTLLGAHMRFRCPDCGYVFDVNYSPPESRIRHTDEVAIPSDALPPDDIYCPNCGYRITSGPRRDRFGRYVNEEGNETVQPSFWPYGSQPQPVRYGDRILVLKYAYLINPPSRWDVVVFKAPDDPESFRYTVNYIKRLVGRPGETLMTLDGGIYVQDAESHWQIQQRPPSVQEALWRLVYNNDYYPQGLPRKDRPNPWVQPWETRGGAGWNLGHDGSDARVFRFSGQGNGTIGYNAEADPCTQTTNDYLVYDVDKNRRSPEGGEAPEPDASRRNTVSDLKLQLLYQREEGDGPLKLSLSKRDHAFTAEISGDAATLFHTHPDGSTTTDAGPIKLSDLGLNARSPLWVEFINVDYGVALRINGKVVLATTEGEYAPDVDELLREFRGAAEPPGSHEPVIQISAGEQTCALSHVSLWRNIFYTHDARMAWAMPNNPVHLHRAGEKRADGSGAYDEDEYFVMGDNSLVSGDARFWTFPVDLPHENLKVDSGRVPGRFLLGKAFFVYWPSGFRPLTGWPAIIPDFGDMRFIH